MKSEQDIISRIGERQMRRWNILHSAERAGVMPHRFITITRDEGTMGDEIAKGVAQTLGWRVYDKEIVNDIAQNSHVHEEMVLQLDEKVDALAYHIILENIVDMFKVPGPAHFGSGDYHQSLLKTLAVIAAHGEAVLVGRGANFALGWTKQGIHARIIGSIEMRIKRVAKAQNIDPETARQRLLKADQERRSFLKFHFNQDSIDPQNYHAVFNTDHLSVEQVVHSVVSLFNSEESKRPMEPALKAVH